MSNSTLSESYSIRVNKRPFKIAFIVDQEKTKIDDFVRILEYNRRKWGGAYNPIILSKNKRISMSWWRFLKTYDPDVIVSFIKLGKGLLERITNELTPYLVEEKVEERSYMTLPDEGVDIIPTIENIRQVANTSISFHDPQFVVFDTEELKNENMRNFFNINFGITKKNASKLDISEKDIRLDFEIKDEKTINKALEDLSIFKKFIYYSQICSLSADHIPDPEYNADNENFMVFVGDSIEDMVSYWNRTLSVTHWKKNDFNHIWIPKKVANNKKIRNALIKWIKKSANSSGTSGPRIKFVSFSIEEKELEKIAENLTKGSYLPRSHEKLNKISELKFKIRTRQPQTATSTDYYRLTGRKEEIVLNPPKIGNSIWGGDSWMADIYIEYKDEQYKNIHGRRSWLELPPRNILARQIVKRASRITLDRTISAIVNMDSTLLEIDILDEHRIFNLIFSNIDNPVYRSDPRTELVYKNKGYEIQASDKGRYMRGIINLFSGLHKAHYILESRYWRRMFNILTVKDIHKYEKRLDKIKEKINKKIEDSKDITAEQVIEIANEFALKSHEAPLEAFEKEGEKESEDFNMEEKRDDIEFDVEILKDQITELISKNVLIMGIKPTCPNCGYTNWYVAEDIATAMKCNGCNDIFSIEAEEKWYYKLNTLIEMGVRQEVISVILILGTILMRSHSNAFLYIPTVDLFLRTNKKLKKITDIDIVCISDGQFIIGEVKNSKRIPEKDYTTMVEVAKMIRPDVLLFSTFREKPSKIIIEKIVEIRKELKPYNVKVDWIGPQSFIFKPSPVY